jgi:DnaJ homologue, subfamily C, member 28, conserved domain
MSFERIADQKILEAMARGEFDNLPGAGQPIDLEEYFRTPEPIRMAYSILKSARCVPEEVELMQEVRALEDALAQSADEHARARAGRRLRDRRLQLAMALERLRARRG